jgi:integrase
VAKVIRVVWRSGPRKVKRTSYGYTLQVDGKQVKKVDAQWTAEDAQKALATRLLERDAPPPPAVPEGETLDAFATEYLAFKRVKGKRSIEGDARMLQRQLLPWFGAETPLAELTALRIAQYDRARSMTTSRRGRLVTTATVNRELALIRHLLRLAEEWGYVPKAAKVRLGREPDGRLRFLTEDEAVRLLDACALSQNPYLLTIVTVALYTGARRGEILGLTWERVDVARGVLRFDKTKNGRRREVPMGEPVYRALMALPGPKAEGLVFRRSNGAAWGSIRTGFERAVRLAKIDDFRFHDLRHTCASWLVMAGRHLKEVQEILGHRTFAMTLRYAHLAPGQLRDAVAALPVLDRRKIEESTVESAQCTVSARRAVSSVGRAPDF